MSTPGKCQKRIIEKNSRRGLMELLNELGRKNDDNHVIIGKGLVYIEDTVKQTKRETA